MYSRLKKGVTKISILLCLLLMFTFSLVAISNPFDNVNKEYENQAKMVDADGNLLVPFDVANEEAFETGNYPYEQGQILLKMKKSYKGVITSEIKDCGIESMQKFMSGGDSSWWKATLTEGTDAILAVKSARKLSQVLVADFDYIYETGNTLIETNDTEVQNTSTEVSGNADVSWANKEVKENKHLKDQYYLKHNKIQESWKHLEDNEIPIGGLSSIVVAVIDTGIDYNHPDLKANMWINRGEIAGNGIDDDDNGYIDDVHGANVIANNGYADMQNTGNPMDDNGHGTHVAGIIAASNNKEGIVGIAFNTKLMAVKAGQASGVFNQSDIAEAILYAYEMGADVINMSFGGPACSIAVQDALTTAYTTATLVAAAGNSGAPQELTDNYEYYGDYIPNYPAALSYVIGVMSVNEQGVESAFTNWDARVHNKLEYEVYAPGEDIMSTLPNGRYGKLSGTSMAAPIISASAAILRSFYTDRDMYPSKFIMAQLVATSQDKAICKDPKEHAVGGRPHNLPMISNLYDALTKFPKPEITSYDYYTFDSKSIDENNSADGVIDAGETIALGMVLRNRWGMSKDTTITIDDLSFAGISDPYVDIIQPAVNFGEVGTYSTKDTLIREGSIVTGVENPLLIKIADNCPNDYLVSLTITLTYKNGLDDKDKTVYSNDINGDGIGENSISFVVRNGQILPSQITEDMTLTKDNYYIIPNSTFIAENVTVTVQPGTQIQFWSNDPNDPYADSYIAKLIVAGKFITQGTVDEPVRLFPSDMMDDYRVEISQYTNYAHIQLNYTEVVNPYLDVDYVDHCTFTQNYQGYKYLSKRIFDGNIDYYPTTGRLKAYKIMDSIFYKLGGGYFDGGHFVNTKRFVLDSENINVDIEGCSFIDCAIETNQYGNQVKFKNCVFIGNNTTSSEYNSYVDNSIIYQKPEENLHSCVVYKDIDTKNIYLKLDYLATDNYYNSMRDFAQFLGGDLCCIETKKECDYLISESIHGIVGFDLEEKKWINGEPIGDFIDIDYGNDYYCKYAYFFQEVLQIGTGGNILIEIPAGVYPKGKEGQDWTEQDVFDAYDEWVAQYSSVSNCAILNNYNDTNTEYWLKFMANDVNLSYGHKKANGVSGNYWGTTDRTLIERQIYDFDDDAQLCDINTGEILTTPPEDAYPFVVDAYLLDTDGNPAQTVGNEKVIAVVTFNRDMDTSIPLRVRFGSYYPYADYEIEGSYVSPREWRGTYTLKTTIENGNLYFNISNACAADDKYFKLYDSPGRFTFKLDTTAAQAMMMQGEATETGIKLTWMQDDFDTLLGYNLYRSDAEDGLYIRLNNYVLAQDENSFFDDTVEPGKIYYYNFTVVKTDFSESLPSGKIVIQSMDTMAPNIYHSPVRTAYTGSNLMISATITDNLMIKEAKLYYRVVGQTEWKVTVMNPLNSKYSGMVSAEYIEMLGLEYYIEAFDGVSYTYKGTAQNPYVVTVKLAVDSNSLGDVDGDGTITVKDAQMLLMAINDLYNLTEDEFMRADIDGNGILQAYEALRILDYISGKITTIVL